MNITELSMSLIDEDKDQPRNQFNEEALQELMQSIEELGLLSPIKVRTTQDGRYKIIYGNRRYKAISLLGRSTIPCIISTATDETEIYLEQIAENLTREGFSPIEEAEAFDKLLHDTQFRSSLKFLANKLGKPEAYIRNKCELLKFSSAVKKRIVSGTEIRKDTLTEDQLIPLKDLALEHRDQLALLVAREELPVSDVKKIAKLFKDKTISEKTKEKLLLKSGSGLIETWSIYEQNRKERARQEQEAKELAEEQALERKTETSETKQTIPTSIPPAASLANPRSDRQTVDEMIAQLMKLNRTLQTQAQLVAQLKGAEKTLPKHEWEQLTPHTQAVIHSLEQYIEDWRGIQVEIAKL